MRLSSNRIFYTKFPGLTVNFKIMTRHNIEKSNSKIESVETFEGESIEQKCRRATQSNEPIEAISPMIYTERKDGVLPEYDIRCDKWLIAQTAMDTIATKAREERQKRVDKQAGNSEMNVQTKTEPTPTK